MHSPEDAIGPMSSIRVDFQFHRNVAITRFFYKLYPKIWKHVTDIGLITIIHDRQRLSALWNVKEIITRPVGHFDQNDVYTLWIFRRIQFTRTENAIRFGPNIIIRHWYKTVLVLGLEKPNGVKRARSGEFKRLVNITAIGIVSRTIRLQVSTDIIIS